ncbi:MAG: hypothetical protein ACKVHP_03155, partial [Verrucomicrobiales bacterium]
PVMADRKATPFAWHVTATRIDGDNGTVLDKGTPYCSLQHAMEPILYVYNKAESPSAGGGSSEKSGFACCLSKLCPINWFKSSPKAAEPMAPAPEAPSK